MTASSLFRKRSAIFFLILSLAFIGFTADILDLREDIGILSSPYTSLDNNVSTGITSNVAFKMEPVLFTCSANRNSSVKISFLHLLPQGFRAPPSRS
jgi:hypothetical protein